jgi:hypothetical protein
MCWVASDECNGLDVLGRMCWVGCVGSDVLGWMRYTFVENFENVCEREHFGASEQALDLVGQGRRKEGRKESQDRRKERWRSKK